MERQKVQHEARYKLSTRINPLLFSYAFSTLYYSNNQYNLMNYISLTPWLGIVNQKDISYI
jgi:hypothetical protein